MIGLVTAAWQISFAAQVDPWKLGLDPANDERHAEHVSDPWGDEQGQVFG